MSNVSGGHKDRCRYVVALQQGLGIIEIIGITVVKGEHYCPARKNSILKSLDQLLEQHRVAVFSQNLKMLSEVLWRHTKQIGVRQQFNYTVV